MESETDYHVSKGTWESIAKYATEKLGATIDGSTIGDPPVKAIKINGHIVMRKYYCEFDPITFNFTNAQAEYMSGDFYEYFIDKDFFNTQFRPKK